MAGKKGEKRDLAHNARKKVATYGTDIDMEAYSPETAPHPYQEDLSGFSKAERAQMLKAGVDIMAENRSGTFIQKRENIDNQFGVIS